MWRCGLQMSDVDFETSYQSSKACVPNIFIKQTGFRFTEFLSTPHREFPYETPI